MWVGVATAVLTLSAQAALYDAATDFSSTSNPNGVWSYGWSQTLGAAFNSDTDVQNLGSGVVQWRGDQPPNADGNPSVFKNTTASQVTIGTVTMPANSLAFHPGSAGQDSVVRFTAPTAGSYLVAATFAGLDYVGPTSTDVHVMVGGVSYFSSVVNGFGPGSATSLGSILVSLSASETVDFAVGNNGGNVGQDANGPTFYYDSTGLQATVTAIPEPATMIAGTLLLLPFGASTLRILRRKSAA